MKIINKKQFGNGTVYALETKTGKVIETTDTFLPYYTKHAIGRKKNALISKNFGSRKERWMIGISTMSGCPVGCKFCATGNKFKGNLTAQEMIEQVEFILKLNPQYNPNESKEFRILTTRMGEPALNHIELNKFIVEIKERFPNSEIAISTIGVNNQALDSWFELSKKYSEIHLQFSVHSTSKKYREWLIPYKKKLDFDQIYKFSKKWHSNPKNKRLISLNFTLTKDSEFNTDKLEKYFPKENFFIKLSPINENETTKENNLESQITESNLV